MEVLSFSGRKIGDYNPLFFKYLLSTPLARKRTCRMGAGAQHFNIGQDGLSKISLCFPLMEEQNKIARLLSLIDERIATQNKIIEKLQSLIKGLRVCCMRYIGPVYRAMLLVTARRGACEWRTLNGNSP